MILPQPFGQIVRERRKKLKLKTTQVQGVNRSNLYLIEQQGFIPLPETVVKIAYCLHIPRKALLTVAGKEKGGQKEAEYLNYI